MYLEQALALAGISPQEKFSYMMEVTRLRRELRRKLGRTTGEEQRQVQNVLFLTDNLDVWQDPQDLLKSTVRLCALVIELGCADSGSYAGQRFDQIKAICDKIHAYTEQDRQKLRAGYGD